MNNRSLITPLLAFAGISVLLVGCKSEPQPVTETRTAPTPSLPPNSVETPTVTFAAVHTILKDRCLQCHNGPTGKEGIDFSSYASVMKGGEDGAIVKPNDPANSLIVQVIHGADGKPKMPPQGDPLTAAQMETIEAWIKAGAPG